MHTPETRARLIYIGRYQGQADISYWLSTTDKISGQRNYFKLFIFESKHGPLMPIDCQIVVIFL